MEAQENFLFEEITIFHEGGVQYGKPVWDFACQLNTENADTLDYTKSFNAFKRWSATQKFPLISRVHIPDGVYPVYLFNINPDHKKQFGVDVSHYAYIGNNMSSAENRFPSVSTDCPFDEELPAPKSENNSIMESNPDLKAKSIRLEEIITKQMLERNALDRANVLHTGQAILPKFMYN